VYIYNTPSVGKFKSMADLDWQQRQHFANLKYPALWCNDETYLWLAGYRPAAEGETIGTVMAARFSASALALPQLGGLVTVGPSDPGRPAIATCPDTRTVIVLAPKTTSWPDTDEGSAIIEYVSRDSGGTWAQNSRHEVTDG
jgi:hypothetical protein